MPASDLTVNLTWREMPALRDFIHAVSELNTAILRRPEADELQPYALRLRDALDTLDSPYHLSHGGSHAAHDWFGLSYANYLVLNRTLLQEMNAEWQGRFVRCLEEFFAVPWATRPANTFRVQPVGEDGKFQRDPIPHYRHGRVGRRNEDQP